MFSAMLIVSGHIFYDPNNNSTVETAFVSDFHIVDMIGIFLLIPLIYIVMRMVEFCFGAATTIFYGEKRKKNIWILIGFWAVILIPWVPYVFSYFPGGIYADTVDSLNMSLKKADLDDHNPILYTMLWRFVFWITGAFRGKSEYYGLFWFTILQTAVLAFVLAGFVYFCYKKEYIDIFYAFCCWFLQYTYSMYFPINWKIYPRFSLRVMLYSAY